MKPFSILQRVLSTLAAALPLVAGADPCTLGAVTGHAAPACVVQVAVAPCCREASAAAPACPYCAPTAPARAHGASAPMGGTCCDMKPAAPAAESSPALSPPAHAAAFGLVVETVVVAPPANGYRAALTARDAAPPGESPPPLSPRAPPLA